MNEQILEKVVSLRPAPKLIQDLGLIHPTPDSPYTRRYGIYECPYCGNHWKCMTGSIKRKHTFSCGCQKGNFMSIHSKKHGLSYSKIYQQWKGMRHRCYGNNENNSKYYKPKGIIVCDEWIHNFIAFNAWAMANGYKEGLQIDRINNDGNYDPSNCRWVLQDINQQNTRLIHKNNTTGYRSVFRDYSKWRAKLRWNRREYNLGLYLTPELAAQAVNDFIITNKTAHPLNIIPVTNSI